MITLLTCRVSSVLLALLVANSTLAPAALELTEFSANSDESLLDVDGESSDWIELYNAGGAPVSTLGYSMSDRRDEPALWPLPEIELAPGEFLVIFASGNDRADPAAELHANFSLSSAASYLALNGPDGGVVTEFEYPKQFYGVSYGAGGYFAVPTPGAENGAVDFTGFVRDTEFSIDRGFYDEPIEVAISTETPDAEIFFTTDGTAPSSTHGTRYLEPIKISTTTILRAVAVKPGLVSSDIDTQTYLFLGDVVRQPAAPAGFPANWGIDNSTSNGSTGRARPADYEMDPEILDQFGEAAVTGALRHHPTISIVMDPDDLWNESTDSETGGIYPNPYGGTGNQFLPGWGEPRDWERSCSAEFIGFEQVPGKQVDCGIRIAGNYARHPNRYKHHLRLTFRRSYGAAKLKAPLFSRTDVDTFDDFILRGGNSESWTFPGASSNGPSTRANVQYIRDQFYKDAQAAMGHLTPSQEYFHLYLNGLYWGLYTLIERVDAHFMSQHLGGDEEDYDVMKQGNVLSDGSRDAWEEMFAISRSGMASETNYEAIQEYLDLDNFIDYVLFNFWAGTADWRNNWRGGRLREPGAGFIYFNWDGERGLGDRSPRSFTFDSTGTNREWTYHATELHHDLKANPEYRIRFADRLNKHLFNDGALTPENAAALYNARAEEIIPSLVAESARWGDRQRPDDPYTTENEWKEMFDFMNGSFFPQRTPVLLGQLRATGVYPDTEPPVFSQHGGQVPIGYPLQILNEAGDVYFTTDGSDPRLVGGAINPAAIRVSGSLVETIAIGAGSDWRYDDSGTDLGTGWREAGYDDAAWAQGPAPLGYGFITDTTLGTIMNTSRNITAYLRGGFDLNGGDLLLGSTCDLHIDGGAIVYVNGVEVIRDEMPEGPISFTTLSSSDGNEGEFDAFPIPIEHFVTGENTIAVEVHNVSPGSSDMAFDMRLRLSGAPAAALEVTSPTIVRARSLEGGEWSALTEATFYNGEAASDQNLVISEIFYNPPGESEDGEFIELLNISDTAISLAGVRFDAGIQFEFSASASLPPGGRVVLTPEEYTGRLANGGEELRLMASDQSVIRSFRYDDEDPWPTSADGLGRSLVLGNPVANPDHSLAESWLPSAEDGGSPGESGHAVLREGDDLETFFLGDRPVEVSVVDGRARVRVPRELGAGGADITIETSSDLRSWETGAASFDGIETDGGSAVMLWSLPLSDREVYARARITLSP